jgi:nicotinic acid mononucleotide adenylyltransferase
LGLTLQRIGILGGAFDPPHKAHVAMAEAAIAQFHLEPIVRSRELTFNVAHQLTFRTSRSGYLVDFVGCV